MNVCATCEKTIKREELSVCRICGDNLCANCSKKGVCNECIEDLELDLKEFVISLHSTYKSSNFNEQLVEKDLLKKELKEWFLTKGYKIET